MSEDLPFRTQTIISAPQKVFLSQETGAVDYSWFGVQADRKSSVTATPLFVHQAVKPVTSQGSLRAKSDLMGSRPRSKGSRCRGPAASCLGLHVLAWSPRIKTRQADPRKMENRNKTAVYKCSEGGNDIHENQKTLLLNKWLKKKVGYKNRQYARFME